MHPLPQDLHIHVTADGSPTLTFQRPDGYAEKMHHSGGALTESIYIYHSTLQTALDRAWPARVLSFGLGLGYNELLTLAELTRRQTPFKIWSFEANPFLRKQFAAWIESPSSNQPLHPLYDQIVRMIGEKLEIAPEQIRLKTQVAFQSGDLELRGAFPRDSHQIADATIIFYDAFSNKMAQDPWLENTIQNELGPLLAPNCLFSTYAATGSLNRGLKQLGFRLLNRPGFQGKRESTLAIREISG